MYVINKIDFFIIKIKKYNAQKKTCYTRFYYYWSRRQDLNLQPLGPEPSALPN